MKTINTYIIEKLRINKDLKSKSDKELVLDKFERVLTKFFGSSITICEDYQGDKESGKFYELNPESMDIGGKGNSNKARRFIKYCEKIEDFDTVSKQGMLSGSYTKVSSKKFNDIWITLQFPNNFQGIRVSKYFYDNTSFEKDQSLKTQRGWNRWQGKAW